VAPQNGQQDQEAPTTLEETADATPDEQVTSLAIGLTRQRQDHLLLVEEVQQLRHLVMRLASPKTAGLPAEMVQAMGKLQADNARLQTNVQRLSDRLDASDHRMTALDAATRPWREFWSLLREDDDVWGAWRVLLRTACSGTRKQLLKFFIEQTDRAYETNDRITQ
jgi:phosphatidylserine/phosphatidylglycerophosphate/cardiolipin synthase-like enzyme